MWCSTESLYSRLPFSCNSDRLAVTWPGRHRDADGGERFVTERTKLKMCTQRDRKANTWMHIDDSPFAVLFAPHLATARNEVPDFFDGSMGHGLRYLTWPEFEVGHSTGT